MSNPVADIFRRAAEANRDDPRRKGSQVVLAAGREVMVAGDLHGNRRNLARVIDHAALGSAPDRVLVLQEIIHGPADPPGPHDRSIEGMLRAARLKLAHPRQVVFLLANHDVAEVTGREIVKHGRGACEAFAAGVDHAFGGDGREVLAAVHEFLRSLPLAVRTPGRVLIAHSLPAEARCSEEVLAVLDRPRADEDWRRGGSLYEWTWGRGLTPEHLDALAAALDAEFFVLAHRHVEKGWTILSPRAISLASDGPRGHILCFRGDETLDAAAAAAAARPIFALGPRGKVHGERTAPS